MSRIRRAFRSWSCSAALPSVLSTLMLVACGGDDTLPTDSGGTGGDLIFATGGAGGSAAGGFSAAGAVPGSNGGATSNGGSLGGGAAPNGGNPSTGGAPASTGGATAAGGTNAGGAANTGGGGPSGLPVGSVCANDSNCSQASGAAVCCVNVCKLQADCPGGSQFLPCNSGADCAQFGGGKVCCKETSGGQTMQYCTKPSGCSGTVLP